MATATEIELSEPHSAPDHHASSEQWAQEPPNDTAPAEDETQYPAGRSVLLVFVAGALALSLVGLDGQILATAIPAITNDFKTILDIAWYNAGLRLTLCSLLFVFGKLYTFFSNKNVFLSSIAIFEVGSLLCGLSPTSASLIVGRAIQGIGSGGIVMGCYAMVNATVPKRKRPFVLGALGAVESGSQAIAPLLGGLLVTKLSWRWCFYINLPLGAIGMGIIALYYRDTQLPSHHDLSMKEKFKRLDLIGSALLLPALMSLLLALQYGGSIYSWTDPRVLVCFVLSAFLTIFFGWWQIKRQDDAMLPPRIFTRRVVLAGMLFGACNNGAITIIQYYTIQQVSAQVSGYLVLPYLIPFILSLALSGTLVSATGYFFPFMLFTSLITPVAAGLLTSLTVESSLVRVSCYQALLGIGAGLGFQSPIYALQTVLPQSDLQYGIACLQFGLKFGPAVVLPAAQALFVNSLTTALIQDAPGLSPSMFESMGLSDLKNKIQASQLQGALEGFDTALMKTFYLPTALASVVIFGALATESKKARISKN